ncbi:MAG: hypothetical protein ABI193_11290 [Minicystis sp.]
MSRSPASFSLIAALFLAACGGEATPPAGTPTAGTGAPTVAPADSATTAPVADPHAGSAWRDDMTKEQKAAFMKARVLPEMSKTFQAFDATRYESFSCKTCHGPQFKDPKAFLPKLLMKDGKLTAFAEKPEVSKFMATKVAPQMAAILGEKPYDPATRQGFGCGDCHTIDMSK